MSRSRFQTSAGPVGRLRIAVIVSLVISAGALLAACGTVSGQASAAGTVATQAPPVGPPPDHPSGATHDGGSYATVPIDSAPNLYEGATVNKDGHIVFWLSDPAASGGAWRELGASTFPTSVDPSVPDFTVSGALLPGMPDAIFIVQGLFTEDGSLTAVAFTSSTAGRGGWGAIKALSGGDLAGSGQGVTQDRDGLELGLENDISITCGLLETAECSQTLPIADCGGDQRVLKFWRWQNQVFVLDHTAGLRR